MAYDYSSGLSGAGTGAIYGNSLGGPVGALFGAGVGALTGFFSGKKKPQQISTFDPQQHRLYEQQIQALQGGGGPLADVYGQFDPEAMREYYQSNFAQPQYQEFQENVVPTITGQFRGNNLQNSSYLGSALSRAGTNVQNNLNSQISRLIYEGQQSSLNRRQNAIGNILNTQSIVHQQPGPSIFDDLLSTLSKGAGDLLGEYVRPKRTPADAVTNSSSTPAPSGSQPTQGG